MTHQSFPSLLAIALVITLAAPRLEAAKSSAAPAAKAPKTAAGAKAAATPVAPELKQGIALATRVQKFYAKTKDFSASFTQSYDYLALNRTDERAGTVQVKRPGLVRWEYTKPEAKLLVLDGKDFWQFIAEDNMVMVKRGLQGNEASAAFSFLWGKGDLLAEFDPRATTLPAGLPASLAAYEALALTPKKPGGSVQRVVFVVGKKGEVQASVLTDVQGNTNRLVFSDTKVDQQLPAARFTFKPPAGATVQELP